MALASFYATEVIGESLIGALKLEDCESLQRFVAQILACVTFAYAVRRA